MEDRQYLILLALLAAALILMPGGALAYNNVDAHQAINAHALEYFENYIMPKDKYLKAANLATESITGTAWDIEDGNDAAWKTDATRAISVRRQKPLQEWIIDGAYSADEPEAPMALRHFYDPEREPRYLTDQIVDWNYWSYGNPQMDAYTWAFTAPDNPYSYSMAKSYYKKALESSDPGNADYGNAWRALGETMHLFGDMTVPAHVRNDGHLFYDQYERFTYGDSIDDYAYREATKSIDYACTYQGSGQTLQGLFTDVAGFTHDNFYSEDTLPVYKSTTTANDNDLYASPSLNINPDYTGYYKRTVDGKETLAARQTLSSTLGLWKTPVLGMDWRVLDSQQQVLIPTAIRADAAVIDAFLPRYAVAIDSVTASGEPGVYTVEGHITHAPTKEWQTSPAIRNGAHLVVGDKNYAITAGSGEDLMTITVDAPANGGDILYLYYDLGGYRIQSDSVRIKAASPTPAPTAKPTPTPKPTVKPTAKPTTYTSSGGSFKSNDILYLEITPEVAQYISDNGLYLSYNNYYMVMNAPGGVFGDDKYLISRVTSYTGDISSPTMLEVSGTYWNSYGSGDNQFWDKSFVESHFRKVGRLDMNKATFGFAG